MSTTSDDSEDDCYETMTLYEIEHAIRKLKAVIDQLDLIIEFIENNTPTKSASNNEDDKDIVNERIRASEDVCEHAYRDQHRTKQRLKLLHKVYKRKLDAN